MLNKLLFLFYFRHVRICAQNTFPIAISSVQWLSQFWLSETLLCAAHQASLSITNSQSLLKIQAHDVKSWVIGKDPDVEKIEDKRRREWQRMRWLHGIPSWWAWILSKLWELLIYSEAWCAADNRVSESQNWLNHWTKLTEIGKVFWAQILICLKIEQKKKFL